MMRILLADDHAMLRAGLRRIIADAFPGAVIAEVSGCGDLLARVRESDWSVLVLDIALGDRNSLELIPELRALRRQMPIVVLSMYKERQFVIRALRAGVAGYLTKDRAPDELLEAIRAVLQHKRYLSESVASQIAEYVALGGSGSEAPHELLSAREYEVFLLLAEAHAVSGIASRLGLSVKTISTYRTRILEKLGLSSNTQLIRYALEHGLVK
ncbi:MAG: DNA-binding response regulator [Planctomycetes bacterium RBG_16_64_10]|nr:MAG: DNA-binding response regulator [Planctomycetes bacterium RBG_16_64_10]